MCGLSDSRGVTEPLMQAYSEIFDLDTLTRDVRFRLQLGQIATKWDKYGTFKYLFSLPKWTNVGFVTSSPVVWDWDSREPI